MPRRRRCRRCASLRRMRRSASDDSMSDCSKVQPRSLHRPASRCASRSSSKRRAAGCRSLATSSCSHAKRKLRSRRSPAQMARAQSRRSLRRWQKQQANACWPAATSVVRRSSCLPSRRLMCMCSNYRASSSIRRIRCARRPQPFSMSRPITWIAMTRSRHMRNRRLAFSIVAIRPS